MNFDNPVYRKTTEDQFSLAKSHFQTQRIYPATVAEEVGFMFYNIFMIAIVHLLSLHFDEL